MFLDVWQMETLCRGSQLVRSSIRDLCHRCRGIYQRCHRQQIQALGEQTDGYHGDQGNQEGSRPPQANRRSPTQARGTIQFGWRRVGPSGGGEKAMQVLQQAPPYRRGEVLEEEGESLEGLRKLEEGQSGMTVRGGD